MSIEASALLVDSKNLFMLADSFSVSKTLRLDEINAENWLDKGST
jgi:hypothetical protein